MLRGVGVLALLALTLALVLGCRQAPSAPPSYQSPRPASPGKATTPLPNFPLDLYQGGDILGSKRLTFHDLLGRQPMVLNFWASNCAPCSAEMPGFEKVWKAYKGEVLFFGLDVGRFVGFGGPEDSRRELRRLGITYPAAPAPDIDSVVALGVQALPSTYFITRDGQIYRRWVGPLTEAQLASLVQDLLRKDSARVP
ncbi:Thiol-disulfide oxidoreductase ResA [bacterium HR23]|nr:Thiol-disulfide oxidoreductase ResA [bacterium HR23]